MARANVEVAFTADCVGIPYYGNGELFRSAPHIVSSKQLVGMSLRAEPNNEYDPNAVAVYYSNSKEDYLVGYIAKEHLAKVHQYLGMLSNTKNPNVLWWLINAVLNDRQELSWFTFKVSMIGEMDE
jgi:hypothetical protein